jgi:hypothetical protein
MNRRQFFQGALAVAAVGPAVGPEVVPQIATPVWTEATLTPKVPDWAIQAIRIHEDFDYYKLIRLNVRTYFPENIVGYCRIVDGYFFPTNFIHLWGSMSVESIEKFICDYNNILMDRYSV